jgi:hypothetical protein
MTLPSLVHFPDQPHLGGWADRLTYRERLFVDLHPDRACVIPEFVTVVADFLGQNAFEHGHGVIWR